MHTGEKEMEMTKFERATLATTGMASVAALMAGSASAQDFDGMYFGASVSTLSGDNPWDPSWSNDYQMESDSTAGAFFGFNKSLGGGNMVAGAELAFQGKTPGDENNDGSDTAAYGITSAIDLKARVGTTMSMGSSPVLLYGFAGASVVSHDNYYGAGYTSPGFNYGVGAEVKFGSNFGVGLEYMGRSMDAYSGETDSDDGANSHQQLSLRAMFHF